MLEGYQVEIGKRNLNAENHWELLDLANLRFEKPTVLCLSGDGTRTNQQANAFAKQAERHLDLMFSAQHNYRTLDQVDILGVKYAPLIGTLTKPATKQLVDAMMKLCVDSNGNRLSLEQAKQNMSRLTFFTYCYGHSALNFIIFDLNKELAEVGYREDEIIAINNATSEVCYAPLATWNKVPSVRVISLRDNEMTLPLSNGLGQFTDSQLHQLLNGVHLHQDAAGLMYGKTMDEDSNTAGSIQIISSGLLNSYSGEINEHAVSLTARDQDWQLKPTNMYGEFYYAPNADCVSQMMAWALCKGVENSLQNFQAPKYIPNTYWQELIPDFKSIIHSFGRKKLSKNTICEKRIYQEINQDMPTAKDIGIEI